MSLRTSELDHRKDVKRILRTVESNLETLKSHFGETGTLVDYKQEMNFLDLFNFAMTQHGQNDEIKQVTFGHLFKQSR